MLDHDFLQNADSVAFQLFQKGFGAVLPVLLRIFQNSDAAGALEGFSEQRFIPPAQLSAL